MATENKYIAVSYDLYVQDEEDKWELLESATAGKPFVFVSGMGMTLDDFEAAIATLQKGEMFDFILTPEQAYGEYVEEAVQTLPRKVFEIDGVLNKKYVYVGAVVPLQNADGERFNGTVTEVTDETVTVDLNHPLAGETLHFIGTVLENRAATTADMEAMAKSLAGGGCGGCNGDCSGCESECGGCDRQ